MNSPEELQKAITEDEQKIQSLVNEQQLRKAQIDQANAEFNQQTFQTQRQCDQLAGRIQAFRELLSQNADPAPEKPAATAAE